MKRLTALLVVLSACGDPIVKPPVRPASPSGADRVVGVPGSAQIAFPQGSLDPNATVEIKQADPAAFTDERGTIVGPVWSIRINGKDHHEFKVLPVVTLPYDPSKRPIGWPVNIDVWNGQRWERTERADIDPLKRTVEARVRHLSLLVPSSPPEKPRVVGRWNGYTRDIHKFNGGESDRLQWGTTTHTDVKEFSWSCREEYSDYLEETRLIVESGSWAINFGASYWSEGVTGDRQLPRFEAVQAGGSWGEAELNFFLTDEEKAALAAKEAEAAKLRETMAGLSRDYDRAPPPRTYASEMERLQAESDETIRKIKIEGEYSLALMNLDFLQREIEALKFKSEFTIISPSVTRQEGTIGIRAFISSDPKHTGFTQIRHTLNVLTVDGAKIEHKPYKEERSLSLNGQYVEASSTGPWRKEESEGPNLYGEWRCVSEYFGDGQVPDKLALTIRGRVAHRVFVPKNDADANVVTGAAGAVDRLIPVAGGATLKLWASKSNTQPKTLPDLIERTDADGRFSCPARIAKEDWIHVELDYDSAEADLWETTTFSIRGKDLFAAKEAQSGSAWSVPVPLKRAATANVRLAKNRKELDLGTDERPASLRMKDGELALEFEGLQSLLINTFILKAFYFNQNTQKMPIVVDVPVDELLRRCPPDRLDAAKARLDAAVKDGKTTVTFAEYVTCQPSCCTMALWCLGFEGSLAEIAQATYDHRKANDGKPDAPPWYFPIPDALTLLDPVDATLEDIAEQAAVAKALEGQFNQYWPYVEADSYVKQQWLANQEDGNYRVWQVTKHFRPALEEKFKPNLDSEEDWKDVFSPAMAPTVLNRLGAGRPAAVSIDHLTRKSKWIDENGKKKKIYEKDMGGHLILLLGAIVDKDGAVQRLIFHDPYGDLSRTPQHEGYHDPVWLTGGREGENSDVDKTDCQWGAYAPYFPPDVNSYGGKLYSKYWTVFRRTDQPQTPDVVRKRMLGGR